VLHQSDERRAFGLRWSIGCQPMADAKKGDRRGGQDVLEMGSHGADIASPSAPPGPYGVGDSPFNPCALSILRLVSCRLLPLPGVLSTAILRVRPHRDGPPRGPSTREVARARLARTLGELDRDDGVVPAVENRAPTTAPLPCGAHGLLASPVDHTAADIKAWGRPCLPVVSGSRGPQEFYPIGPWSRDQPCSIEIAGVNDVPPGQQLFRR
jgi:hypothetical protein